MIGVGPVPRQILETLTPGSGLGGMIVNTSGWDADKASQTRPNVSRWLFGMVDALIAARPSTDASSTTSKNGTATMAEPTSTSSSPLSAVNTADGSTDPSKGISNLLQVRGRVAHGLTNTDNHVARGVSVV